MNAMRNNSLQKSPKSRRRVGSVVNRKSLSITCQQPERSQGQTSMRID